MRTPTAVSPAASIAETSCVPQRSIARKIMHGAGRCITGGDHGVEQHPGVDPGHADRLGDGCRRRHLGAPAARSALPKLRAIFDAAYHVPVAVTSVVIGMAVLPDSPRCAAGGSRSRRRSACGKESSDTCDSLCGRAPDGVAAHHRAPAASLRADQATRLVAVWSPSSAGCRYILWTWLWFAACISP